jgi:hypothetical protein
MQRQLISRTVLLIRIGSNGLEFKSDQKELGEECSWNFFPIKN